MYLSSILCARKSYLERDLRNYYVGLQAPAFCHEYKVERE
jgi:hypothetical protein